MKPYHENFYSNLYKKTLWWCLELNHEVVQVRISPSFEKLLGTSVETFDDLLSFMLPESANLFMSKTETLVEQISQRDRFITGLQVGSEVKWLINELNMGAGKGTEIICANCIDVTEMYELEEKLVESNSQLIIEKLQAQEAQSKRENELLQQQYKEQTRFLAMLSHELRSPLIGLGSLINVIKRNHKHGESILEPLKVMRLTIDQLNFLINDILTYSQTQSEHIRINPAPFSVEEMVEYVSHLTKSIANEKGVFVSFSLNHKSHCFYGDLLRISQILINLIVNAIKFTQKGGVVVDVTEHGEALVFVIADSGEGIAPEQLENIFEPFKQLESKGSEQHLGSGLGLPVVKTLVDLLKGSIDVQSKLGEGTTFKVIIPVEIQPCPKAKELQNSSEACDAVLESIVNQEKTLKVLIADDSIINRKVLEVFLHELHCEVDQAADGGEAWRMFGEKDYDFVFLDIQMPILNGAEVCGKIRQLDRSVKPNLKGVFALTAAHTEEEVTQMGIELDKSIFDEWIEKPISEDKVIRALYSELCEREEIASKPLSNVVPSALNHLIPQFVESTQQDLQKLRELALSGDDQAFKKVAHSLKGNLMMFEVTKMIDIIKQLEQKTLMSDQPEILNLLDRLEEIFEGLY